MLDNTQIFSRTQLFDNIDRSTVQHYYVVNRDKQGLHSKNDELLSMTGENWEHHHYVYKIITIKIFYRRIPISWEWLYNVMYILSKFMIVSCNKFLDSVLKWRNTFFLNMSCKLKDRWDKSESLRYGLIFRCRAKLTPKPQTISTSDLKSDKCFLPCLHCPTCIQNSLHNAAVIFL